MPRLCPRVTLPDPAAELASYPAYAALLLAVQTKDRAQILAGKASLVQALRNTQSTNARQQSLLAYYESHCLLMHSFKREDLLAAMVAIDLALATYPHPLIYIQAETEYLQDCYLHSAYIRGYLPEQKQASIALLLQAWAIDAVRFIANYTTEGRELIFWAMQTYPALFPDIVQLQQRTGLSINANACNEAGQCALLVATLYDNLPAIEGLLTLGANPLYPGQASDSALAYALVCGKWDIAALLGQRLAHVGVTAQELAIWEEENARSELLEHEDVPKTLYNALHKELAILRTRHICLDDNLG